MAAQNSGKPAVLIVGGLGFIGRYLALYIHRNNLASEVRLVDKVLPQLAWLAPEFADACSPDKFMQADAGREQSLSKVFTPTTASSYTYVFNCGGETRYSQDDSVYAMRSTQLTTVLARECARREIPAFIELSTGHVYKTPSSSTVSSGGCVETSPLKPGPKIAKHMLDAEIQLAKIRAETGGKLRYAILRLANVYGDYETGYFSRGLCMARVWQKKGVEMKFLYGKEMRINTVHVLDVCDAMWKAAIWICGSSYPAEVATSLEGISAPDALRAFNIVDEGDTSQGQLAVMIRETFGIPTGFTNSLLSSFAKFNMESVCDEVNEELLDPWADLLLEKGITRVGPINPYMEKELLRDADLCLNGRKAREVLGWSIPQQRKKFEKNQLQAIVDSYRRMGWWP